MTGSGVTDVGQAHFDYSQLDAKVAAQAKASAHQVRSKTGKLAANIIEIGQVLIDVKEMVGHGHFGSWLASEFGWSERSARNFMLAAQAFEGKTATVADLAPTTLYALSSPTAASVREAFIGRKEAGATVTETEIKDLIWEARQATKADRLAARITPDQRRKKKQREERQERDWQKRRAAQEASAAERQDARDKAVEMVRVMLGTGGLPGFLRLLEKAGQLSFSDFD